MTKRGTHVIALITSFGSLIALPGCRDTPAGPALTFSLSASPNPIAGQVCAGCGAGSTDRESTTMVTIRETAGASGTASSIAMVLRDAATNTVIAQGEFTTTAIGQLAGSSRLAAGGTLTVPCGVHYGASEAGRAAVLTFTVRVTDDRGTVVEQTLAVPVIGT